MINGLYAVLINGVPKIKHKDAIDVSTPHVLADLESAVCSETELGTHNTNVTDTHGRTAGVLPLGQIPTHGAAKHTDIAKKLFLPATSGFVEAGTVKKGSEGVFAVVQGAANTDTPKVYVNGRVPEDFVSFTALKAVWRSPVVSGNMHWYFKVAYAPEGEYHTLESPPPVTTPAGGWNIVNVQEAGIELVLIAAGHYFGITFGRLGSNPLDTLDDTMDLWGFLFEYIANQ